MQKKKKKNSTKFLQLLRIYVIINFISYQIPNPIAKKQNLKKKTRKQGYDRIQIKTTEIETNLMGKSFHDDKSK